MLAATTAKFDFCTLRSDVFDTPKNERATWHVEIIRFTRARGTTCRWTMAYGWRGLYHETFE